MRSPRRGGRSAWAPCGATGGSRSRYPTTERGSPRRIWARSSIRSSRRSRAAAARAWACRSPTRSSRSTAARSPSRRVAAGGRSSPWTCRSKVGTRSMPEGRILIVDDEEIVQDVLQTLLQKRGYEAVGARSGEEGLEKLARGEFDVVLLDLMLP